MFKEHTFYDHETYKKPETNFRFRFLYIGKTD
jgi:hypothetical protein